MHKITSKKKALTVILATTLLGMAACTPTQATRGNFLDQRQIDDVTIGTHSRYDVLRYLGSPTATAPFDENRWYYIGQKTEKRGILDHDIAEEQIIAVQFDKQGIVQTIEKLDTQREDIPVNDGKTPTSGNEMTLMQQLLGNLGKFNPPAPSATDR